MMVASFLKLYNFKSNALKFCSQSFLHRVENTFPLAGSWFIRIFAQYARRILMVRFLSVLICIFWLSGCSLLTFFEGEKPEQSKPAKQPPARTETPRPRHPQADQLLGQARRLWKEDSVCSEPRKAVALLTQVLRAEPKNVEALRLRALAYKDLKYWEGAEEDATKAVVLKPDAMNYAARSLVFSASGNFLGAEKDARRALIMDEKLPMALIAMATVYFRNNDDAAACRSLQAACDQGECLPWKRAGEAGMCTGIVFPGHP